MTGWRSRRNTTVTTPAVIAQAGGLTSSTQCEPMQADTHGQCYVFDWTDQQQLTAYFDLHDRLAASGIDAFWLDWCCEAEGAADDADGSGQSGVLDGALA